MFQKNRIAWLLAIGIGLVLAIVVVNSRAAAQRGGPQQNRPQLSPQATSVIDVTGYWVSIVDEDWRWRMMTPAKGDFSSLPLNAEGRKVANAWDPMKDVADGNECKAYGAAGLMRVPERLHITWADEKTLEIDTDAGMQKRLLHFDGSKWQGGDPQWQGDSVADWEKQLQNSGYGHQFAGLEPGKGGTLHVETKHMKPGYLRKNGVPYSADAVLIEYFDRVEHNGNSYLILTSVVDDPLYLNDEFITSEQYRLEPNAAKWNPTPCRATAAP
jgi:hypothetical protein